MDKNASGDRGASSKPNDAQKSGTRPADGDGQRTVRQTGQVDDNQDDLGRDVNDPSETGNDINERTGKLRRRS